MPTLSRQHVLLLSAGMFLTLILGFAIGVHVGERKFRHFSAWSDRYDAELGRPMMGRSRGKGGPMRGEMGHMPFPGAHGVFGKVVSVSGTAMVVEGRDGIEQGVQMTTSTKVRSGAEEKSIADLSANDSVVVFGAPSGDGEIDAQLIRIFPATTSTAL